MDEEKNPFIDNNDDDEDEDEDDKNTTRPFQDDETPETSAEQI